MRIALSSDHRGFSAKERIANLLERNGFKVIDFGCNAQTSCDYPDHGLNAAQSVAKKEADVAIMFCGTGIGMSIVANKVTGVRAALCHDELTAELSRRHNNANVLCLPADLLGEELMRRVVETWLKSDFDGGRHAKRIEKITHYEQNGHQ